jgi:hemerythrin-like domain-containing protein
MPHLSDGQLSHIHKEADEVFTSLERRIQELEQELSHSPQDRDTLIKASTKRDVTRRFLRAIQEEQEQRRNNPAIRNAAGESLPPPF